MVVKVTPYKAVCIDAEGLSEGKDAPKVLDIVTIVGTDEKTYGPEDKRFRIQEFPGLYRQKRFVPLDQIKDYELPAEVPRIVRNLEDIEE